MTSVSPARAAAFRTLRRTLEDGAYVDRALRTEAASLEEPRDRALAKRLAFGATQRRGTLDWVLADRVKGRSKLDPAVRAALHLGLYELMFARTADHAAVSEAVELAKPSPGHKLVNAVLRRTLREPPSLPEDSTVEGAAVRHAHPEWMVRMWWDALGAEATRALLIADNEPAELALRVNPLRASGELPDGRREGDALVLEGPIDLASSDAFRYGAVTPMSRAAQMVAPALGPQPGERVLDLCAAPGGKTAHIAALMEDSGTVVAVERHAGRARQMRDNLTRLGVTCAEVVVADAGDFRADEPFDRVLLDPPCSGLGTLRGNPDLRWRVTAEDIPRLAAEQDRLLAVARAALKPGGTLVYSTCTISAEEERLFAKDAIRTRPDRDDTDGFYIARQ